MARLRDRLKEGLGGGFRVFRRVDRAADDNVVGAERDGILGRGDSCFVAVFRAGEAYSWRYKEKNKTQIGAHGCRFLARCNDAIKARHFGHPGASYDEAGCGCDDPLFLKIGLIEIRQYSDGQKLEFRASATLHGCPQRLGVVSMHCDEVDAEPRG